MKNRVNKQIIKALSVGLAASMALQPVTVFAETPEGDTTNTGAATTTPTPAQTAAAEAQSFDAQAQAATNAVNAASDALVATTPETPAQDYIPSAEAATDAEKTAVGNVLRSVGEDASEKIDKKDVSVNVEYDAVNTDLDNANTDLGTATSKIGEAQTANKAVEDYNKAVDTSIVSSNEVVETLDKGTLTKIDGQDANVNVKEYGDTKKDVKGAINDANAAKTDYNSAEGLAGDAFSGYSQVIVNSDNYIKNDAATDVSGEVLDQIKKDAAKCDKDLTDAKDLVKKAKEELEDAQAEFDEANIALGAAQKEFEQAKADYIKVSDPDFNASAKAIELAKNALTAAQSDFDLAKAALKTAEDDVKAKIDNQNSAKYAQLVALQKEIDNAKKAGNEEAEAKAIDNFQKELIKYCFLGDNAKDVDVVFSTKQFSNTKSSDGKDEVELKKEDGKVMYISGYDDNNQPIWTELPSVLSARYTIKDENGKESDVVRLYEFKENGDGSITITELTENQMAKLPFEVADPIAAHYVKGEGESAENVSVEDYNKYVAKDEIIDANGKQTGSRVSNLTEDEELYDYHVNEDAPKGTWKEGQTPVENQTKYVIVKDADGKVVTGNTVSYDSEEKLPIGDFITEEVVTGYKPENIQYDFDEYAQWRSDIVKYENKEGFEAIYYSLSGSEYHFYENYNWLNRFFDRLGAYFAGSFEIKYKSPITTEKPTGERKVVSTDGFVVEEYVTYESYTYTKKKDAVTTTNDVTKYAYDGDYYFDTWGRANAKAQHLKKQPNIKKAEAKEKFIYGYGWVYYVEYVETETIEITPAKYEWVKDTNQEPKKVTTSKKIYKSEELTYDAGDPNHKNTIGYYYNVGFTPDNNKVSNLNTSEDKSKMDHQKAVNQAYVDAQTNFDATKKAFEEAQNKLYAVKSALDNLKPTEGSKKDYVDAYNNAKKALEAAEDKKKEAEKALNAAKEAKKDADSAVLLAGRAKTVADSMLTNAEAAKRAADEARNTPTGGGDDTTTTGGDDTTTGGGDDTTTFIPVAVTPATNVVAPAADNAEAPAVLGARTTRRTAAKSAADTDTVATDNSNGNGGNDNSAVAGAQKEETKTPEAPKEETKIEDSETALAATPELEEKGFAWWWLLILAAIAGVSVEEYARRKSNKAKAEAKDSTKINK